MNIYKADIHIHHHVHDPDQTKISYHYVNFTNKSKVSITLFYRKKIDTTRGMVFVPFCFTRKQNFLYQYFDFARSHTKSPRLFDMSLKIASTTNQNNVINHLQSVHGTHWYGYCNVNHLGSSQYQEMILPTYLFSFKFIKSTTVNIQL